MDGMWRRELRLKGTNGDQGSEEGRRCFVVKYRSLDPLIGFSRAKASA